MRRTSSRRSNLGALSFGFVVLFTAPAFAGGERNAAGNLEIPISGQIYQFDREKIEVKYLKRILVFKRGFAGLPEKLEPRPEQSVRIRFTLTEWQKLSAKLGSTPISKQTRIDLRETFP